VECRPQGDHVTRTLSHLSDLHLGRSDADAEALRSAVDALVEADVDHVVVTGDLTEGGLFDQLGTFQRLTAPLADRLTVVPGNHDRLGENAGRLMMRGRVAAEQRDGLYLVRVDSTAPHNRRWLDAHGQLTSDDLDDIEAALDRAPDRVLVAVLLHHHVHRLPGDDIWERVAARVGLPWTAELHHGAALLERLQGRCDLVLHGHRHVPAERLLGRDAPRPLRVVNAGSSTGLGRSRLFSHQAGRLTGEAWLVHATGRQAEARPVRLPAAA
jgi:3',5'-cyclic AMP phosphodiesterase CpdA